MDQRRFRQAISRAAQLLAREVDPGQAAAGREDPARLNSSTDTELEHIRSFGQQLEQVGEVSKPALVGDLGLPGGEPIRDRVVTALDDPLGIVLAHTRSITAAIAWPKPMHIVATP